MRGCRHPTAPRQLHPLSPRAGSSRSSREHRRFFCFEVILLVVVLLVVLLLVVFVVLVLVLVLALVLVLLLVRLSLRLCLCLILYLPRCQLACGSLLCLPRRRRHPPRDSHETKTRRSEASAKDSFGRRKENFPH